MVEPFPSRAVKCAAAWQGYDPAVLLSGHGPRHVSRARWAIMVAMRRRGSTLNQIGHHLGRLDHSTVRYGLAQAEIMLERHPWFGELVKQVEAA